MKLLITIILDANYNLERISALDKGNEIAEIFFNWPVVYWVF